MATESESTEDGKDVSSDTTVSKKFNPWPIVAVAVVVVAAVAAAGVVMVRRKKK